MSDIKKPLAEENLGLVHLCANKFRGRGIEYEELYSAGCIGLLKAVKSFDTERGVKFSTYAVPVIIGEIKRLFRDGGMIKVSRSLKELSFQIQKIRENFLKLNGREPLLSELSELSGADVSEVSEALCVSQPVMSLTAGNDDENQIDIPSESPDTEIVDILALRQIMAEMEKPDRFLLELRYFKGFTQSKTAEILGMTQVQVSRRERKLLLYIREKLLE
ncbi:MAG: sigma-70 family RNA polymerase sigma factor [Ruminococcus sp.]|nr:sigma-70 family RNA polymerase sigma factor [Oscillospiraceae bacterium]MDY4413047.1 sigma-70 family RNA polymerase sigma factor [Ruminococcus sp.]